MAAALSRTLSDTHSRVIQEFADRYGVKVQRNVTLLHRSKTTIRQPQPRTGDDDRILLAMAGYKTAEFIAKALHLSENAVRHRVAVLGKSSRVHLEGHARRTLAEELHLGSSTIQRLIVRGLLEVRDPWITGKSLEDACKTGRLTASPHDQLPDAKESAAIPREEGPAGTR